MSELESTSWAPERKIVGAAVATLLIVAVQLIFPDLELPAGAEAALATVVAYLVPNR